MPDRETRYGSLDRVEGPGQRMVFSTSQQSLPPNLADIVRNARERAPFIQEIRPSPAVNREDLSHSYSIQTITSLRPEYAYSDRFYAGERSGGKMSNIRRFFCLFATFDLLFTGLMWLICIMLRGENIMDAFNQQIYHYNIHSSLFDIVLAALCRFVTLLLFYALLYINHWIIIAITTSATCAFLIAKVFVYNWQGSSQPVFEVLLVLTSFVIAWAEAWFLDFKVIPQEQYAEQFFIRSTHETNERTPLVQNYVQSLPSAPTESVGNFYSPLNSPEPSVHKLEIHPKPVCPVSIPTLTLEEQVNYKAQAGQILRDSWSLLHSDMWKLEKENEKGDLVYVMVRPKSRKIYKLFATIDAPARYLLEELFYNVDSLSSWNPSVLMSHKIKVIDEYTDITYQVSADAGGGIISSRDFVTLRHWGITEGCYVIGCKGIEHPSVKIQGNYVRGMNGLGCWAMGRMPENPNKTIFQWILNTDIKGWIPGYVLEPAFIAMLFDYIKYLRIHLKKLKEHGKIRYDD